MMRLRVHQAMKTPLLLLAVLLLLQYSAVRGYLWQHSMRNSGFVPRSEGRPSKRGSSSSTNIHSLSMAWSLPLPSSMSSYSSSHWYQDCGNCVDRKVVYFDDSSYHDTTSSLRLSFAPLSSTNSEGYDVSEMNDDDDTGDESEYTMTRIRSPLRFARRILSKTWKPFS